MTPFSFWQTGMQFYKLGVEAQSVVTMRVLGAAGLWNVLPDENARMISEKQQAFSESAFAAGRAALSGHAPEKVVKAALRPLRLKTRSNVRRLSKRGPKAVG